MKRENDDLGLLYRVCETIGAGWVFVLLVLGIFGLIVWVTKFGFGGLPR